MHTGKADIEHINTVGDYIKGTGGYSLDTVTAADITPKGGIDPLYVVTATAK